MNQAEFIKVVESTMEEIRRLLATKGAEYAGSEDRLANFKRGAANVGVTPLQTAMIYLSKHYDAVNNYVRNAAAGKQQFLSEPIEGRLDDLINYCILMKALIQEESKVPAFQEGLRVKVTPDYSQTALNKIYPSGN